MRLDGFKQRRGLSASRDFGIANGLVKVLACDERCRGGPLASYSSFGITRGISLHYNEAQATKDVVSENRRAYKKINSRLIDSGPSASRNYRVCFREQSPRHDQSRWVG